MIYIIWKEDGSIKEFQNNEVVNQHSHKVNKIYFAFENKSSNELTADTIFTLVNKDEITKVATPKYFTYKGVEYHGFEVSLTDDVTAYCGALKVVCRILNNEAILYSYQFDLNVNASISKRVASELDVNQYEQLMQLISNYLERYDINILRKYDSLESAQSDTKLGLNSVVYIYENGEFLFYKKIESGFVEVPYKSFEELVRATPTSVKTDLNENGILLYHDSEPLSPQSVLNFKTINGEKIFGTGTIATYKVLSILGHTGTFTDYEKPYLKEQVVIKDLDTGLLYSKVKNNLFTATSVETNGAIRIWFIKVDEGYNWEITSQRVASIGDIYEPKKITLQNARDEATNGTLTDEEYNTLTSDNTAYIFFNKEKYNLADNMHNTGSMTYTHLGYENNVFMLKAITITLNNKTWVLNQKEV